MRPFSFAIASCGSSTVSAISARSWWRKRALPSIVTLASRATTSRSAVTISGLTSIRRRVLLARHLGQLHQHLGGLVERVLGEPGGVDDRARRGGVELAGRVDVAFDQRVGVLGGDRLDVHPALGGDHRQQLLLAAVEDHRGVVLVGDVGAALDPDLVDAEGALAVRADDVHAEDRVGVLARLARRPAAILIPPALPRPPISTWALIAQG